MIMPLKVIGKTAKLTEGQKKAFDAAKEADQREEQKFNEQNIKKSLTVDPSAKTTENERIISPNSVTKISVFQDTKEVIGGSVANVAHINEKNSGKGRGQ